MKLHENRYEQFLPISLDEAWDFFSRPENLNEITPDDMQFEILTKDIPRMYQGQIIQYNVTPFPFVKMGWVTEITHVEDRKMFVDEQRFGPYSFWHHQHFFEERENGVLMTDILHYRVPLGIVGKFINWLLIKRKVKSIFEYRFRILENKFGKTMLTVAERA
ncbi:MAG: SRPBCC family protein [Flavobacteriales bacterium]|nr:SRPBCC family protein [Flavobacteriales bacterium]MCB9191394.1 SRPBCC family protein [Flavobacteriales bacterium]MCB9203981.1 SRPBCC family protein [Flavobacteriales bacterium]